MNHLVINIAYIEDNQEVIDKIVNDLKSTGVSFNLIEGNSLGSEESFYTKLAESSNPSLLMISDNFLKSSLCLKQGLVYLQTLIKNEQVLLVVIDGVEWDAAGNKQSIPTEFGKVSNVIKYMNFWQEKYLALRKLKRTVPKSEEAAFSQQLKEVRTISSEVGEFLRNLRDTNYFSLQDFSANYYEVFFRYFGDEASFRNFVSANRKIDKFVFIDPSDDEVPASNEEISTDEQVLEVSNGLAAAAAPTNEFLPIEDLIGGKEQTVNLPKEKLLTNEDSSVDIEMQLNAELKTDIETDSQEEIEIITDKDADKFISLDPEWDFAKLEEDEVVEEEISLNDIVSSEKRPLTETELLALELAQKLPSKENQSSLNLVEETGEIEETEKIIPLSKLIREDKTEDVASELEDDSEFIDNETRVLAKIEAADLFKDSEETSEVSALENEDELEGYFMDEGEETEEIEEELSEFDILLSTNTLVQSGKVEAGITLLKETLEKAPDFVSVRYQYAAFLAKYQGDLVAASQQLGVLLEQDPSNISAKFFLGELAEAEKEYLMAEEYYKEVHHTNPEFPNVAYKLGMLLVNYLKDNPLAASNYLQEAYKLDENNVNSLYQYAIIQNEHLNNQEIAITAFKEVLTKAPEHPFINYDLAVIYHKMGELEKALDFYEQAIIVNPELRTTINDQAFEIEKELEEADNQQFVELVEDKEKENYIISNLVANVHPTNELKDGADTPRMLNGEDTDIEVGLIDSQEKMDSPKPLNKTVLITGATSGIGRATAIKFAKEGYQLILTGRRFSRLFQLKDTFEKEYDSKVKLLPFDVSKSTEVKEALGELEEDWKTVDILINNAGLAKGESEIHEGEIANWEAMIDTNLKGLLYVTREIAPLMVKRRKGQIINVCSLAGKEVYANNAVYCATKHAVNALSKAMRVDLHQYNIKISQVSPGFVEDTEFAMIKSEGTIKEIKDFVPINATDVAEVIFFMATQPSHVTLQEVVMTGTQQANATTINRSGRT